MSSTSLGHRAGHPFVIIIVVLLLAVAGLAAYIGVNHGKMGNGNSSIKVSASCRKLVDMYVGSGSCKPGFSALATGVGKNVCVKYAPMGQEISQITSITGKHAAFNVGDPNAQSVPVAPKCRDGTNPQIFPNQAVQYVDEDGTVDYSFGTCMTKANGAAHIVDVKVTTPATLGTAVSASAGDTTWLDSVNMCRDQFGGAYDIIGLLWQGGVRIGMGDDGYSMRKAYDQVGAAVKKAARKQPYAPVAAVCVKRSTAPCTA